MEELLDKALNGDKTAYVKLIDSIGTDLYRVAQAKLNNIDDINDAISETVLKSYKYLTSLKTPQYFKTWITKILINECNNIHQINKKQLHIYNKIININDFKIDVIDPITKYESNLNFENMIENLNSDEKLIMVLYYNHQYNTAEIAKLLHQSSNTVKSRLLRAKKKLQKQYNEGGIKL